MNLLYRFFKMEYFKSIDEMPIYNWFKIQETNDLTYLLKVKRKCSKSNIFTLQTALQDMTNEYIDTFGVSDDFRKILKLKGEILAKEVDLVTTGQRINNTFINVLKAELNSLLKKNQKSDTVDVIGYVSKYQGYRIDVKVTTVKEFYGYLKNIKKDAEASHKQ